MSDYIHAAKEPHVRFKAEAQCGAKRPENGNLVTSTVKSMVTCWQCVMLLNGRQPPEPPPLPEHDKLKAAKGPRGDDTQLIGEFLEWLGDSGYVIGRWNDDEELEPFRGSRQLLEEFFEVDAKKLSDEKDALLDYQRKINAAREWAETDGREALRGDT